MKVKTEERYLDKEWIEMGARMKAFLESGDQEQLHKFRVQVKKLRAMLVLFENTSNKQGLIKHFKPVKKIFKYAGVIRDAHIRLQLSERHNLKNEFFETGQQQIIADGTREFLNNGTLFFRDIKTSHKKIGKQLRKIDNERVRVFYEEQLEKIAAVFAVLSFDETLHAARKLLKILIYNHKIAAEALEGKIALDMSYLDKLQEAIGKWHDNLLAEELFSTPWLIDKPLVTKIKRVNAGIKRNIGQLANGFPQKAVIDNSKLAAVENGSGN